MPSPCPLCGSTSSETVYQAENVPFANIDCVLENFTVALCRDCGFTFQSSAYDAAYDGASRNVYASYAVNRQFPFPERSGKHLVALEDVLPHLPVDADCSVLEIGANRGDFLYLLKEARPRINILGLEPTRFAEPLRVPTLTAPFDPRLFSSTFDLVVAKHVVEHIKDPVGFLRSLHGIMADGGLLYIEVPDLDRSLEQGIEDFIPDHVSYFDRDTLIAALDGFEVVLCEVRNFLHVLARRRLGIAAAPCNPAASVDRRRAAFTTFTQRRAALMMALREHARGGGRIVFYGAGFYFARLYKKLTADLGPGQAAYRDDNMADGVDPTFGLPQATVISPDDMVLVCTNNVAVQEKMESRLVREGVTAPILRPWHSLRHPTDKPFNETQAGL